MESVFLGEVVPEPDDLSSTSTPAQCLLRNTHRIAVAAVADAALAALSPRPSVLYDLEP
jgi:hypothetical protein